MGIRFRLTRYIDTFGESAAGLRAPWSVGRTPLGACPPPRRFAVPVSRLPAVDTVRTISEKGTWIDTNTDVLGYLRRSFCLPVSRAPPFAALP